MRIPDWIITFQLESGDKIWHTVLRLIEADHLVWHEAIETVEQLTARTAG